MAAAAEGARSHWQRHADKEEVGLRRLSRALLHATRLDSYEARLQWTQRVLWPVLGVALLLVRWSQPGVQIAQAAVRSISIATLSLQALVLLVGRRLCQPILALGRSSWVRCLLQMLAALALLEAMTAALEATLQMQIRIEVFGRPLQLLHSESPVPRYWARLLPRHLQLLPAHQQRLSLHILPLGHRALEFCRILPMLQRLGMLLALVHLHLHRRLVLALGEARAMQPAHNHMNSRPVLNSRPVMAPFRSTAVHPHRAGMSQCMEEMRSRSHQ